MHLNIAVLVRLSSAVKSRVVFKECPEAAAREGEKIWYKPRLVG